MNDAVTKILDLADALAQEAKDYGHLDHSPARRTCEAVHAARPDCR